MKDKVKSYKKGSSEAKAHVKKRINSAKRRVNSQRLREEYLGGDATRARKDIKKMTGRK